MKILITVIPNLIIIGLSNPIIFLSLGSYPFSYLSFSFLWIGCQFYLFVALSYSTKADIRSKHEKNAIIMIQMNNITNIQTTYFDPI